MKSDPRVPFFHNPYYKDWLFYAATFFYLTQIQSEITLLTKGDEQVSLGELIFDVLLEPFIITTFSLMAFVLFFRKPFLRWKEKRATIKERVNTFQGDISTHNESLSLSQPLPSRQSIANEAQNLSINLSDRWRKFRANHSSSGVMLDNQGVKQYEWKCSCGAKKILPNNSGLPLGLKVVEQNHFKEIMGKA